MNNLRKWKKNIAPLAGLALLLVLWEMSVRLGLADDFLFSMPSKVLLAGSNLISSLQFYGHFLYSLSTFLSGLICAIIVGVFGGVAIGSSSKLLDFFKGYIFALGSLPIVAVIPLIIIWFGLGFFSKTVIIFLISLSPILISAIEGVKNTDKEQLVMARSFGASGFFITKHVIFFSALPFAFAGIKTAVGRAVIGVVISEIFGYGRGLGFLISYYGGTYQVANLIFVIVFLLALSISTVKLIEYMERKVLKWKY